MYFLCFKILFKLFGFFFFLRFLIEIFSCKYFLSLNLLIYVDKLSGWTELQLFRPFLWFNVLEGKKKKERIHYEKLIFDCHLSESMYFVVFFFCLSSLPINRSVKKKIFFFLFRWSIISQFSRSKYLLFVVFRWWLHLIMLFVSHCTFKPELGCSRLLLKH